MPAGSHASALSRSAGVTRHRAMRICILGWNPGSESSALPMGVASTAPSIDFDASPSAGEGARLRLRGRWTLRYATDIASLLRDTPHPQAVDVRQVARL